jgi:primase-polymerase (primpol)-like protein
MKNSNPIYTRNSIPQELRDRKQWVVWRLLERDGKPTKVLFQADRHTPASSTNPETWAAFEEVQRFDNIGFVFSEHDPYVFMDFDKCFDDPLILTIIRKLDSYTELSPSGKGYHVILKAKKKYDFCRAGDIKSIEVYEKARFTTITGNIVDGRNMIQERQAEFDFVYGKIFKTKIHEQSKAPITPVSCSVNLLDQEILDRMPEKIKALYNGQWQSYFESQSEADYSFLGWLLYYTDDREQIDRIFRSSKLYRKKWERKDYQDRIISTLLKNRKEVFNPVDVEMKVLRETEKGLLVEIGKAIKWIAKSKVVSNERPGGETGSKEV